MTTHDKAQSADVQPCRRGGSARWGLGLALAAAAGLLAWYPLAALGMVALAAAFWLGSAAVAYAEWVAVLLCFAIYTRLSDVLIRHVQSALLSPDKLLVAALLGAVALRWLVYRKRPEGWFAAFLFLCIYGASLAIAAAGAAAPAASLAAMVEYAKNVLVALLIIATIRQSRDMRHVVWALLAAGGLMGAITVFQYLTNTFDHTYWGFALAPEMQIVGETGGHRVSGPVGDPNFFAQIMLVPVPLALERLGSERRLSLKVLAAFILAVSVLSIIFTFSRGGFLALVVMVGVLVMRMRHARHAIPVVAAIGILALAAMPATYSERIMTLITSAKSSGSLVTKESSFRGRTSEILCGWMMFIEHPGTGVGPGNYAHHYQDYARRLRMEKRLADRNPHSLYLEILAETGILGFAAFAVLMGAAFTGLRRACRRMRDSGARSEAAMGQALTAGLFGYLVAGLFLHSAYPAYLWLLAGIAFAFANIDAGGADAEHGRTGKAGQATGVLF